MSWLTIESDPAVFTTLISDLGVEDVIVEELFSIDAASINAISPLYGIIFLFKYQSHPVPVDTHSYDESIWFAHQIIQNACGTQALLAILLNREDLSLGPDLSSFRDFTHSFDASLRGEAMTNSDLLRLVHNSFSRAEMYHLDESAGDGAGGEAPHHFVGYIVHHDRLIELDGLQPAPIDHGECRDVGAAMEAVLRRRMERYRDGETHFNVLAVTRDPLALHGAATLTDEERRVEEARRERRRREIALRRHNFAAAILKVAQLACTGKSEEEVSALIQQGKARTAERIRREEARQG